MNIESPCTFNRYNIHKGTKLLKDQIYNAIKTFKNNGVAMFVYYYNFALQFRDRKNWYFLMKINKRMKILLVIL